jgi:hypothetical protein
MAAGNRPASKAAAISGDQSTRPLAPRVVKPCAARCESPNVSLAGKDARKLYVSGVRDQGEVTT